MTLRRRVPLPLATGRTPQTHRASCSKSAGAPANHASVPASSGFRKPPRPDRPRESRSPSTEAAGLASAVVSEIHAVDPDVVVYGIRTMQERLHDSLARQRFSSTMLGAFAAFALLLAAVGLYGVLSFLATQSTRDIGILVA